MLLRQSINIILSVRNYSFAVRFESYWIILQNQCVVPMRLWFQNSIILIFFSFDKIIVAHLPLAFNRSVAVKRKRQARFGIVNIVYRLFLRCLFYFHYFILFCLFFIINMVRIHLHQYYQCPE